MTQDEIGQMKMIQKEIDNIQDMIKKCGINGEEINDKLVSLRGKIGKIIDMSMKRQQR